MEKYDSVTKQPLSGAEFKITTANGELVADNEGLTSSNGLYTTDIGGQIVLSKLLPGTYVVTETRAPDNYQLDPKSQTVVVNAGDTQTIRFYNDPLCTLTILKRDAVTRKPLAGATFLVRDSEGRAIGPNNGLYTTGSDGTVDELTAPMLNEFIEKVVVHEADKSTGDRRQKVDIYFNFIGCFVPPKPEVILTAEEEAKEQKALAARNREREQNKLRMRRVREAQRAASETEKVSSPTAG